MNENRTLDQLETPFLPRRVVTLRADGKGAICHNRNLQQIDGCIYRGENGKGCDSDICCCIYACYPEVPVGVKLWTAYCDELVENAMDRASRSSMASFEDFMAVQQLKLQNQGYFSAVELEFMKSIDPDLIPAMEESKRVFLEKKAQREKESKERYEEKKCLQTQALNEKTEQSINAAISVLQKGGVLENSWVNFYTDPYSSHSYRMINYLMRKYGVEMPLRTQGWVNSKLARVWINEDGSCTRLQLIEKKGNASQIFFDCMVELIRRARKEI